MPGTSYTRATLRSAVLTELQDSAGSYFTTTVVNGLIDNAMSDWCEMSRMRRYNWQIDIVAQQSVYSLSSLAPRCFEILRASCPTSSGNTDDQLLELRSAQWMDNPNPDDRLYGRITTNWRSEPASWPIILIRDIQGPQSLRLWPTPDSSQAATVRENTIILSATTGALVDISGLTLSAATATYGATVDIQFLCGSLQLYGIAGSTDFANVASFSDTVTTVETACGISPDFQDALLWYVCARCCEIDVPIAQAQKAQGYWAKWQDELNRALRLDMVGMQSRPASVNYGSTF